MRCYDCTIQGDRNEAIGVCHHCSVGLCENHGTIVPDVILGHEPIAKTVALPKKARALLCRTCLEALQQPKAIEAEEVPDHETLYKSTY
ncbi:MAG: DUF2180 family protein [Bdellovibrionales bacterium]|nr:DUF2180 family protein [Bdellovibrionales bacterium]